MSAPTITLRMDLTGTAFGAAPTWSDQSAYLATAGDGSPIAITWGRQDEDSDVPPSTCTFVLDNTDGRWTPGNAAADVDWDVGVRVNVRVTHNAVVYDRFDGYVDSIEPAYPGQSWSQVVVACTDITARLGRANGLRSLLQYEMLADTPSYFYPLTEDSGSAAAADISGNSRPPSVKRAEFGGTFDYGSDMGLLDGGTGINFGDGDWARPSAYLSLAGETVQAIPTSGGFSISQWVKAMPPAASGSGQVYTFLNTNNGSATALALFCQPDGTLVFYTRYGAEGQINATSPAGVIDGGLHLVTTKLASDRKTMTLEVDGVVVATAARATAATLDAMNVAGFGGFPVISGGTLLGINMPLNGSLSHIAIYNAELATARSLAHYKAGVGTNTERSDLRFARIAGYGGITTAGLPTGQGTMGGQKTAGLPAIEALRLVGRSEGAPVFATKTGAMTMQARNVRYAVAAAATLTGADINPDLTTRRDRQGLANEVTVTNQGRAGQNVKDLTSQSRHGRFDAGSFEVSLSSDDEALNLGQWEVLTGKNPLTRLPALKIDLLTGKDVATVAAALTLDISSKVLVTGLPSQAPASTFTGFIEGGTETIGVNAWSISFFTSPVTYEDSLFTLDDATLGQLNGTGVLAF